MPEFYSRSAIHSGGTARLLVSLALVFVMFRSKFAILPHTRTMTLRGRVRPHPHGRTRGHSRVSRWASV